MKRLLSTTALLSLVLAPVQPLTAMAQGTELRLAEDGSVIAPDGTVLCLPTADLACDPVAIAEALNAKAAADAAAQAEADAAAAAAAQAAADADAGAKAEADAAAAQAAADADAAAKAEADAAAAAAQAAADADAAAKAEADAAAAQAAAAKAADAEAAVKAEAEAAEAAAKAADAEAAVKAEAEAAAAAQAATDAEADAAAAQAAADADASAKAEAEAAAAATQAADAEAAVKAEAEAAAAAAQAADAEAAVKAEAEAAAVAPAEVAAPVEVPVDVPVVTAEEAKVLTDILSAPVALDGSLPEAVTALAPAAAAGTDPSAANPATLVAPEQVTVTTVTEGTTRSSAQEFDPAPKAVAGNKKSGLSDLEKVGLLALGALVVGAVLNDGREVVSNTGDRVVVRDADGGYAVYKDDDTLLRRPGSTVQTETFRDGSTRSTVNREDNTQVVTIRDASGRVLRRAVYDARGTEVVLIDDLVREDRIDVSTLPVPRPDRVTISTNDGDAALKAALAREEAAALGRSFSLRQIREIAQVRALAATLDVDNITFDTGSAVILPSEARKLAAIGGILEQLLRDNPAEVFLIEGHTDAVGSAFSNLTLSDRRAESLALALTEYYGIPPENMVVQGYGEGELRVPSSSDERANRRAAVRVITPLMRSASR